MKRTFRVSLMWLLLALAGSLALGGLQTASGAPVSGATTASRLPLRASVPKIRHVFVINIENKDYMKTWGAHSQAPYLAKNLRGRGVLLSSYYGTAHNSQSNYIAQVSGQGPNPEMQADCQTFSNFVATGWASPGQLRGSGCVFPRGVFTLMKQLDAHRMKWRGYMDGMGTACRHPAVGTADKTQKASATNEYATRHNPFVYFHDVIDHPRYCKSHVVRLMRMVRDLRRVRTTPNLSYITPNLCNDGHDAPCANGQPGGLVSVDRFLRRWVPKILRSPAYRRNGMLVITADESDGPQTDASSCCNETAVNTPAAGIVGSGGGRIGALVLSRWTRGGSWATTPYNHYSLLAGIEDGFRFRHLGYASTVPNRFGLDVYNNGWNRRR